MNGSFRAIKIEGLNSKKYLLKSIKKKDDKQFNDSSISKDWEKGLLRKLQREKKNINKRIDYWRATSMLYNQLQSGLKEARGE